MDLGLHLCIILIAFWHRFSAPFQQRFSDDFVDALFRLLHQTAPKMRPEFLPGFSTKRTQNALGTLLVHDLDLSSIWARFLDQLLHRFEGFGPTFRD